MGNYIVSARKYRPDIFTSVVGQSHITNTLKSAILLDQLAHAFLFSGPRGVGKTTCARILAKAINCENLQENGEPCNECESCTSYNDGKSFNIHELDAASNNSVDDIRNLIEQTRYVPPNGKKSVYIIDEVHMLSQAAFNAFLKTLEEPPPHVLFILATTEKHKILPTILSRCQKFDFRRIKVEDIAKHLEYIAKSEQLDHEFAALQQIALKADGALRDALSLYDQLVSSYGNTKLTFEAVLENLNILDYEYYFKTVKHIQSKDHGELMLLLEEIISKGFEAKEFLVGLTTHFRNLLVCQDPKTVRLLETSENVKKQYAEQCRELEPSFLVNAFHLCSEAEQQSRYSNHPRLKVELVLIKLAHLQSAIQIASGNGVEVVKKKIELDSKPPISKASNSTEPPLREQLQAAEKQAVAKEKTKTLEEKPTQSEPDSEADSTSTSNGQKTPAIPVQKHTRKRQSLTPKIGNNFGSIKGILEKKIAEENEQNAKQEEVVEYSINPDIQIDIKAFDQALSSYLEVLKRKNKINLATAIQNGKSHFEGNKWNLVLDNTVSRNLLDQEQDILPFMREKLGISVLFWELSIDESLAAQKEAIPYTEEEKLKVLSEKNESIQRLQEIFKTRIIYE